MHFKHPAHSNKNWRGLKYAGVMACLIALIATPAFAQQASPQATASLGDPAKELTIGKWVKGDPVEITAEKNDNIHVVEFWATWCPPCRESIPHLSDLQKKYADKGVKIIGISNEDASKVEPFVKEKGEQMAYTVAVDKENKTSQKYMTAYGVNSIPHAFIVDKNDKIVWHGHPMMGLDEQLDTLIAAGGEMDTEKLQKAEQRKAEIMQIADSYFQAAAEEEKPENLEQQGQKVYEEIKDDPRWLATVAMLIIEHPAIQHRDLDLAMKAAQRARELSEEDNLGVLEVNAKAYAAKENYEKAIELRTQAMELVETDEDRQYLQSEIDKLKQQMEEK